jgi:hypothetical protein
MRLPFLPRLSRLHAAGGILLAVVILILSTGAACGPTTGSVSTTTDPPVPTATATANPCTLVSDVHGTYSGDLAYQGASIPMGITISQNGCELSGVIAVQSSDVPTFGDFTGTIDASAEVNIMTTDGSITLTGTYTNGNINGTWNDYPDDIGGSWSVSLD